MAQRLGALWTRCLAAFALLGSALLLGMVFVIVADVALRNLAPAGWPQGLAWSNEVSEMLLYLIALSVAPWLLRRGQHIRVDIVLRAVPARLAWGFEALGDALGLICCLAVVRYGALAAWDSYRSGALSIKTLVTPEWWILAPLPLAFAMLAVEMVLRLRRLLRGERAPRADAVSAA